MRRLCHASRFQKQPEKVSPMTSKGQEEKTSVKRRESIRAWKSLAVAAAKAKAKHTKTKQATIIDILRPYNSLRGLIAKGPVAQPHICYVSLRRAQKHLLILKSAETCLTITEQTWFVPLGTRLFLPSCPLQDLRLRRIPLKMYREEAESHSKTP